MYVQIEMHRKQTIWNLGKKGRGPVKKLSCPQVPMTFDTFPKILQSLNCLQIFFRQHFNTFNHTLNARNFAGAF